MELILYAAGALYLVQLAVLAGNLVHAARYRPRAARSDLPALSVLIPARNEEDNLRRLLPGLLAQDHPDFEVIVVDDASDDGTADVLTRHATRRLRALRSEGPPAGWLGKPHALHVGTRVASGRRYLFLDADVELSDPGALSRLATRFETLPEHRVLTGLPALRGGGLLLVSQVPAAILSALPWPLAGVVPGGSFAGVNGQCWMIDAATYHRHEPHAAVRSRILEDVHIGRLLSRAGVVPVLADLRREVIVHMYRNLAEAWRGFRKNAYLILGGRPWTFIPLWSLFVFAYGIAPLLHPVLLVPLYVSKAVTDRYTAGSWWLTPVAPLSYLAAAVLQLDSFLSHRLGRVAWKGRTVRESPAGADPTPTGFRRG